MMLTISDKAHEMLLQYSALELKGDSLALRIEIVGRGPKGFQYDLQFIDINDASDEDVAQEARGISSSNCSAKREILGWCDFGFQRDSDGRGLFL